jgi:hypothetical protein
MHDVARTGVSSGLEKIELTCHGWMIELELMGMESPDNRPKG